MAAVNPRPKDNAWMSTEAEFQLLVVRSCARTATRSEQLLLNEAQLVFRQLPWRQSRPRGGADLIRRGHVNKVAPDNPRTSADSCGCVRPATTSAFRRMNSTRKRWTPASNR